MLDRMVEMSSSVSWTTRFRYSVTPPYFPSSSERKANIVSGLRSKLQQTIPDSRTGM